MEKLRRFREQRGYSIRRLAKKAGVRWTTVWKAETGRRAPAVATPKELAKALGLMAADLL
ncbi:MAG: helix-turn-helix domain-containing protein [Candidatus Methylomirabilales bacterium]